MRIIEDASKKVAQASDHVDRFIVSLLANECRNSMKSVEEEVRFDLAPKRLKSRGGQLLIQASSFRLLQRQSLS